MLNLLISVDSSRFATNTSELTSKTCQVAAHGGKHTPCWHVVTGEQAVVQLPQ
jgi:hypothetical protein